MFSITINNIEQKNRFSLSKIISVLEDKKNRMLNNRIEIEPYLYDLYLNHRESINKKVPRESNFSTKSLYPGTWYLKSIDENYRRSYERVSSTNSCFNTETSKKHLNDELSKLLII